MSFLLFYIGHPFFLHACVCRKEKPPPTTSIDMRSKSPMVDIALLGDSAVGKTSLYTRFATNTFNQTTSSTLGLKGKLKVSYVYLNRKIAVE